MTKHRKDIKKLSTAILRGSKIAKEKGIKQGRYSMVDLKENGKIDCACALGMAYIGTFGLTAAKKLATDDSTIDGYSELAEQFPEIAKTNVCFAKKSGATNYQGRVPENSPVEDIVVNLNDKASRSLGEIVKKLKECNL